MNRTGGPDVYRTTSPLVSDPVASDLCTEVCL